MKNLLKKSSERKLGYGLFSSTNKKFKMLYIFIMINHGARKIEHFNVNSNPDLQWVKQQISTATPYDHQPKYLIHDNDSDSVFTCEAFQGLLSDSDIKSKRTNYKSPCKMVLLNESMVF